MLQQHQQTHTNNPHFLALFPTVSFFSTFHLWLAQVVGTSRNPNFTIRGGECNHRPHALNVLLRCGGHFISHIFLNIYYIYIHTCLYTHLICSHAYTHTHIRTTDPPLRRPRRHPRLPHRRGRNRRRLPQDPRRSQQLRTHPRRSRRLPTLFLPSPHAAAENFLGGTRPAHAWRARGEEGGGVDQYCRDEFDH